MNREKILQEVLSDPELMEKYGLTKKQIEDLTTSPPYHGKTVVEIMSVIINENDNHLSGSQIYRKIKNIHNI